MVRDDGFFLPERSKNTDWTHKLDVSLLSILRWAYVIVCKRGRGVVGQGSSAWRAICCSCAGETMSGPHCACYVVSHKSKRFQGLLILCCLRLSRCQIKSPLFCMCVSILLPCSDYNSRAFKCNIYWCSYFHLYLSEAESMCVSSNSN